MDLWPLVKLIVCDGDQKIPDVLSEHQENYKFALARDPGHVKNNLQRNYTKAYLIHWAISLGRLPILSCKLSKDASMTFLGSRVKRMIDGWSCSMPYGVGHGHTIQLKCVPGDVTFIDNKQNPPTTMEIQRHPLAYKIILHNRWR